MNLLAGGDIGPIIIMIVLVVAIIGLFIWSSYSNKKKRKEAEETLSKIKIGDRVKTIGGICGFIAEINDSENTFVLETGMDGKKSFVKFDKAAIYQTAPANGSSQKKETKKEEPAKEAVQKEVVQEEVVKEESVIEAVSATEEPTENK